MGYVIDQASTELVSKADVSWSSQSRGTVIEELYQPLLFGVPLEEKFSWTVALRLRDYEPYSMSEGETSIGSGKEEMWSWRDIPEAIEGWRGGQGDEVEGKKSIFRERREKDCSHRAHPAKKNGPLDWL